MSKPVVNLSNMPVLSETGKLVHISEALSDSIRYIEKRASGEKFGYKLRWQKTNQILGGELGYAQNLVIGARPGVGKSAYVNILIQDAIELNPEIDIIVPYYNWEMANFRQGLRFLSYNSKKKISELNSAEELLKKEEIEKLKELAARFNDKNLFFINRSVTSQTINDLTDQIKSRYPKHHIINVLDHTRLVKRKDETKEEEKLFNLLDCLNEQKKIKGTTNLIISQLNRNIENPDRMQSYFKPMLSDLFGADAVGQYAETVFILHRPEKYGFEHVNIGGEVIPVANKLFNEVVKNRDGDSDVTIIYNHDLSRNQIDEV